MVGHLCLREESISFDNEICGFWLSFWYLQCFLFFCSTSHEYMPTWYSHRIMFVSFNSKTMGATSGAWTSLFSRPYEVAPGFLMLLHLSLFCTFFQFVFASLFVLCTLLVIVLYDILRFKTLDYIYPLVSSNVRCMSFLLFWPLYGMTNVYWLLMRYVHI